MLGRKINNPWELFFSAPGLLSSVNPIVSIYVVYSKRSSLNAHFVIDNALID